MLSPDVGCLQTAVVAVRRVVPIPGVTRSRELGPASADHCPATHCAEEALLQNIHRVIFVGLYRLFPDLRDALAVVRPETVNCWHLVLGFRAYWRWRSNLAPGKTDGAA